MKSMHLPLVEGAESEEKMDLLLSLKRFSENTQKALKAIYCKGYTAELAANNFDLVLGNLNRSIDDLKKLHETIHKLTLIS